MFHVEKQFTYHRKAIFWCYGVISQDTLWVSYLLIWIWCSLFIHIFMTSTFLVYFTVVTISYVILQRSRKIREISANHSKITLVSSFTKLQLFFRLRMSMEVAGVTTCQHHNLKCPLRSCIVPVYSCVVSWQW